MPQDSDRETLMGSFRLHTACRLARKLYVDNQPRPDLSADYEAVQAWQFAPSIYSGIEQALKQIILLKASRDEGDGFDRDAVLAGLRKGEYGHNIGSLFERLKWCANGCQSENGCRSAGKCESQGGFLRAREHIESHYREHASLWDNFYDRPLPSTAEEFIGHISDGKDGYTKWRYLLIEPEPVPMLSLWTMLEIWHGACCHIKTHMEHEHRGPDGCFSLSARLRRFFDRLRPQFDSEGQEWAAWLGSQEDPLPAWIGLLAAADRGAIHEIDMPPIRRSSLADTAQYAIRSWRNWPKSDLRPSRRGRPRIAPCADRGPPGPWSARTRPPCCMPSGAQTSSSRGTAPKGPSR